VAALPRLREAPGALELIDAREHGRRIDARLAGELHGLLAPGLREQSLELRRAPARRLALAAAPAARGSAAAARRRRMRVARRRLGFAGVKRAERCAQRLDLLLELAQVRFELHANVVKG